MCFFFVKIETQLKEESQEEIIAITRERVKVQQELDNVRNIQSRQLKEHEQVL